MCHVGSVLEELLCIFDELILAIAIRIISTHSRGRMIGDSVPVGRMARRLVEQVIVPEEFIAALTAVILILELAVVHTSQARPHLQSIAKRKVKQRAFGLGTAVATRQALLVHVPSENKVLDVLCSLR